MSDPYVSQIEVFGFNYAPRGWLLCAGQLLPINQYQALFALLGTTYGGNGTTNFMLPDLRSRVAVGMGQSPGLSNYTQGEKTGQENVTVLLANMPDAHTHTLHANNATTGGTNTPANNVVLASGYTTTTPVTTENIYSTDPPTINMGSLSPVGGQPHSNMMPYLALNYCICISGLFPSRN
jgi:microcystin-dependent protein